MVEALSHGDLLGRSHSGAALPLHGSQSRRQLFISVQLLLRNQSRSHLLGFRISDCGGSLLC